MQTTIETKVFPFRWFVLFVASMLGIAQQMSFFTYPPVANFVDEFYGAGSTNQLSIVFLIAAVPSTLLAMYLAQRFGLRIAVLLGLWSATMGTGIRIISSISSIGIGSRKPIVFIGQIVVATGNPFALFLPTKVSSSWFPDHQRALSTSIVTISAPFGIMLINLIGPNVVKKASDVFLLNVITFVPAILGALLATFGICNSTPPLPPSKSATQASLPFFTGIKKLFTSRTFLILFIGIGGGLGLSNALFAVMQQILCARGYSNFFAGICTVLIITGGVVGAILSGIVADKTKKFELIAKVNISIGIILSVVFALVTEYRNLSAPLGVTCFLVGMAVTGFVAIGYEMSAECTFPVAESTALGFIALSATIQGIIYIALMQSLATPILPTDFDYLFQVCVNNVQQSSTKTPPVNNMTVPLLVFCGIGTFMAAAFIILFKPRCKRMMHEAKSVITDDKTVTIY